MAVMEDVLESLRTMLADNDQALERAAVAIATTARSDGLLRPAGAGHSLAMVMETFFRAGGLAFVRPLWHESVLPLSGARASTAAERRPGLGREVAQKANIAPEDTVLVVSTTGTNPFPVEIAEAARAAGASVIAMTSCAASAAAPIRAGRKLMEFADIVLDTHVPVGDVTWPPEAPATAPLSSLATTALWTDVLRRVHRIHPGAPCWRSANVEGNDEFNHALAEHYGVRVPEL